MSIVSPRLVIGTFNFRFELSLSWLIIPNVVLFLLLKLLFMVHWWCIFCITVRVCLILGMWQARTETTRFVFALDDLYWSSASRCGLACDMSRDGHVLSLILMNWPIISPKSSANWVVLTTWCLCFHRSHFFTWQFVDSCAYVILWWSSMVSVWV